MASSVDFVAYVVEQMGRCGVVRYRKMFGEYMIYLDERPIFLVCDDMLFVKQLPAIIDLMGDAELGIPFPKAKEWYLVDVDDPQLVQRLALILREELPIPKPKASRKKKAKISNE